MTEHRADAELIGALAFTIVRAGARDGMSWWDDEALTEAGTYALAKIFPRSPQRVARRLGYCAARARHAGVFAAASLVNMTTLFDLVQGEPGLLTDALVAPEDPISSPDELRVRLVGLSPEIASVSVPPPRPDGILDMSGVAAEGPARLATILAAGYLAATKGMPVFPFVHVDPERQV